MIDRDGRRDNSIHYAGVPYDRSPGNCVVRSITENNWPSISANLKNLTGVELPDYDPRIDERHQTSTANRRFDLTPTQPAATSVEADTNKIAEPGKPLTHADHVFRSLEDKEK